MVVVAVKKFITKKGKRYGPYPKDPNTYYLYEVYRDAETGKVKQKFIGKGPRSQPSNVDNLSLKLPRDDPVECMDPRAHLQMRDGAVIVTGKTTSHGIVIPSRTVSEFVPADFVSYQIQSQVDLEKGLKPFEMEAEAADFEPLAETLKNTPKELSGDFLIDNAAQTVIDLYSEIPKNRRIEAWHFIKAHICMECGSMKPREVEGRTICSSCGVEKDNDQDLSVDFDLGLQGSPGDHLAFGRGLGWVSRRDLLRILATAPGGSRDLGLRRQHMSVMSNYLEPPAVHRMLEIGRKLCKPFDFKGADWDVFGNRLGDIIRKVGTAALILKMPNQNLRVQRLARTCVILCWQIGEKGAGCRREIAFEPFFPGMRKIGNVNLKPNYIEIGQDEWNFALSVWFYPMRLYDPPTIKKHLQQGQRWIHPLLKEMLQTTKKQTKSMFEDFPDLDHAAFEKALENNVTQVTDFWVGTGFSDSEYMFPREKYATACVEYTLRQLGNAPQKLNVNEKFVVAVEVIMCQCSKRPKNNDCYG